MKKFYFLLLATALFLCGVELAFADDVHPWAGTYTIKSNDPLIYEPDSMMKAHDITLSDSFNITISWIEAESCYRVTKFMGWDLTTQKNGGLLVTLDGSNEKVALMETGQYQLVTFADIKADTIINAPGDTTYVERHQEFMGLLGANMSSDDVKLTKQSDGQISMGNFVITRYNDGYGPAGWFDKNTPTNGGDVIEYVAYDWDGYYKVTSQFVISMDGNDYPEEFVIAVKKDAFDNYYITRFMGHDTDLLNLSAFYVTPDEENGSIAYIECTQYMNQIKLADEATYTYLVLLDGYGQNGKVQITHNDDDSFDIDYFDLATFGFADTEATVVCYYLGATAVKITEDEANEFETGIDGIKVTEHESGSAYNLAGQRIQSPMRGQIYIQNGKKFIAH